MREGLLWLLGLVIPSHSDSVPTWLLLAAALAGISCLHWYKKRRYRQQAIERYKLTRCEVCGEWQNGDRRGGVLCVCAGVRCKWCGERFHRPISDYFDEKTGKIWHVPWFGQLAHESKPACRRAREEKQRRLAVREECIDCGRRVLAWAEWEPVEIEVDEWGRRCTQCRNTCVGCGRKLGKAGKWEYTPLGRRLRPSCLPPCVECGAKTELGGTWFSTGNDRWHKRCPACQQRKEVGKRASTGDIE